MYSKLKIKESQCAYCLREGQAKTADHFKPVVNGTMPTGYVTDITNLVPCCKDCNSKKAGKEFDDWFDENNQWLIDKLGNKNKINERKNIILEAMRPNWLDYKQILGRKGWHKYTTTRKKLERALARSQKTLDKLAQKILDAYNK